MKKHKRTKKASPRRRRPVVRGPQATLPLGKSNGDIRYSDGKQRTPRLRFMEKPVKVTGNPFFALRVPSELLAAFRKYADKKHVHPNELLKRYMSKVTGVEVEHVDAE